MTDIETPGSDNGAPARLLVDWRFVILLASCACAACIFFRKQFSTRVSTHVLTFLLLAVFAPWMEPTVTSQAIVSVLWVASFYRALDAIKMDVFLWNFVYAVSMTVVANHQIDTGGIEIVTFAVPQFARKPEWLKTKLQYIRSLFGPFYTASQVLRLIQLARTFPQPRALICTQCVATVFALLAGVIFRPDNATTAHLIGYYGARRRTHGYLMTLSFMAFMLGGGMKRFV